MLAQNELGWVFWGVGGDERKLLRTWDGVSGIFRNRTI